MFKFCPLTEVKIGDCPELFRYHASQQQNAAERRSNQSRTLIYPLMETM